MYSFCIHPIKNPHVGGLVDRYTTQNFINALTTTPMIRQSSATISTG